MIASLRALAFAAAFYVTTALFLLIGSPLLFAPRAWAMAGLRAHGRTCLFLLRWIGGCAYEIRGRENLPPAPCLIVSKHQSAWETLAYPLIFRDPAIVLKAELLKIPLYGAFCRKFAHIPISREGHAAALRRLVGDARARATDGRDIIIFAEGTRRLPDASPAYKPGYTALYDALGLALVPVALNSGVAWPPRSSLVRPGRAVVVEILPAIAPGAPRKQVARDVADRIELATAALVAEARPGGPAVDHAAAPATNAVADVAESAREATATSENKNGT